MKLNKKLARSVMSVLAAFSAAATLSSCSGGGGGGGWVSHAWYNVYGQYCFTDVAPEPGCDFFADGTKATYWDDPNVAPLTYGTWYYIDVYGFGRYYTGYTRITSTGMMYDEYGYAINTNKRPGRDAIAKAAAAQKAAVSTAAERLEAKYGLSEDVAMNVAVNLNDYALLGKSRKRTDKDEAEYAKRVGLDLNEINSAVDAAAKGDTTAADAAIEKAAAAWSTSPDTMKRIVSDWYGKQMSGNLN
jgi:hypothetical protein